MIFGNWAVCLNLLSMASLLALALGIVQLALVYPVRQLCGHLAPEEQKYLLLGWASLPWLSPIMALLLSTGSTLEADGTLANSAMRFHWHHADWFLFDSWHMLPLIIGALWLATGITRTGIRTLHQRKQYQQLKLLSSPDVTKQGLNWLPTEQSFACTAGLINPQVFVARGLAKQLSPEQLGIVLVHEQAHIRHLDNQSLSLMNLACSLYPAKIAQPMMNCFALATEQLADAAAARSVSATEVAMTLVKVTRLNRSSAPEDCPAFLTEIEPHSLQIRVNQLLNPVSASNWLNAGLLTSLLLIILGAVSSVDSLHHGVEWMLGHG